MDELPVRRICCFVDDIALTIAKLPIMSFTGAGSCLDPMDVAVFDPHAVTYAQVEVALVFDDQGAARIESHGDAVLRRLPLLLLDFVSDDGAADCADDGGRRVPAAASDLVADHATGDAADHGSAIDGLVFGRAIDLDSLDFALVTADGASAITTLPVAAASRYTDIQIPNRRMNRVSIFIFLCVMSYRVGQSEDDRNDASGQRAGAASIGFFVNAYDVRRCARLVLP